MKLTVPRLSEYVGPALDFPREPIRVFNVWTPARAAMIRAELDAVQSEAEALVFQTNGNAGYENPGVRSCTVLNPGAELRASVTSDLLSVFRPFVQAELKMQRASLHGEIQFIRYRKRDSGRADHFVFHADAAIFVNGRWLVNTPERHLTFSAYVNDDFSGGDFVFKNVVHDGGVPVTVQPRPGLALLFPSDPRYEHAVTPMRKGTRYAMVGWLTMEA